MNLLQPQSDGISPFEGDPFDRLCLGAGFGKTSLTRVTVLAIAITALAWIPMLVLSVKAGVVIRGAPVPFLYDIETQARFLVALPLLIISGPIAHRVLAPALRRFRDEGIVPESDRPKFNAILASTARWSNSFLVELFLLTLVFGAQYLLLAKRMSAPGTTWYLDPSGPVPRLTLPGYWYGWVAVPILEFILVRWCFRQFLWGSLLLRISRLDLHPVPAHPDHAGGLGFLGSKTYAFNLLVFGLGVTMAGTLANRVFYGGGHLEAFLPEIGTVLGLSLLLVLGPLLVFVPRLIRLKRGGTDDYGFLAVRYVREFERKWLRGGAPDEERLIGSPDIQSLSDLANSYEVVAKTKPFPFGTEAFLRVVVFTILPTVPLLLTMIPARELLRHLLQMIF